MATVTPPAPDMPALERDAQVPVPRRRPWHKTLLQWLRRGHLYAGLLMLPWVVLYGITAFLFNHPTVFSDRMRTPFGRGEMQGTSLEDFPSSADIARQAVAAINAQGKGTYQLVQPEKAKFERGALVANVRSADGKHYTVVLQPDGSGGSVASRPEREEKGDPRAPFAARSGVRLEQPPGDRVKQGLPTVLEKVGFADVSVADVQVPPLSFLMEGEGKLWQVNYVAQAGSVSGRPVDGLPTGTPLTTRNFLLRLHLAHGYPADVNARWLWAVGVDATAVVMLFWCCTGLLMWWQIKATRVFGFLVMIVSVVAATWVGLAMHDVLTGR